MTGPGSADGIGGTRAEVLMVDSVGKAFGERVVLRSGSFRARSGEILCLMGRNGEGKTTLLRIAAGLLAPDHGTVRFAGTLHLRPRLHVMARRGLLYLSQDDPLPPGLPVRHALRALAGMPSPREGGAELDRRLGAEVDRLRLGSLLERGARDLSGGERARAAMAGAALRRPACLLFDEPLAGTAPRDRELLSDALRRLAGEGCAVVVTGHEAADMMLLADRVVWVTSGTTRDLGHPDDAKGNDFFRRHYLGWSARGG